MRSALFPLLSLVFLACSPPRPASAPGPETPPPPETHELPAPVVGERAIPTFAGITLPRADDAPSDPLPEGPVVAVVGGRVEVGGKVVADTREIEDANGLRRVDGLFVALKAWREDWRTAHAPGLPFPGLALFAFDADARAVVVKSVFQTAAFAGFPNLGFLVARGDSVGYFPVDASVPGRGGANSRLSPEVIRQRVMREKGAFRDCYKEGVKRQPGLRGRIQIHATIERDGHTSGVSDTASTFPDRQVVACVVEAFRKITFPAPEGGTVTIDYPMAFAL